MCVSVCVCVCVCKCVCVLFLFLFLRLRLEVTKYGRRGFKPRALCLCPCSSAVRHQDSARFTDQEVPAPQRLKTHFVLVSGEVAVYGFVFNAQRRTTHLSNTVQDLPRNIAVHAVVNEQTLSY